MLNFVQIQKAIFLRVPVDGNSTCLSFIATIDVFSGLAIVCVLVAIFLFITFLVWNRAKQRSSADQQTTGNDEPAQDFLDVSRNRRMVLSYSMAIMSLLSYSVGGIATLLLYKTSFEQQRQRLIETASAQARLIEAIARFDRAHSDDVLGSARADTISQIVDAHHQQTGLGNSGEFMFAQLVNNEMVFLMNRRHDQQDQSLRIPFVGTDLAEPMRLALSGKSGTVVATDYRGKQVLAAYEPVGEIDLGIVAKIDIDEIRRPFNRAALVTLGVAALLILLGGLVLVWVNTPLLNRLEDRERRLKAIVSNVVDAIFTIDDKGNILSFNHAAESIFGYDANEVVGRNASLLVKESNGKSGLSYDDLVGERIEAIGLRKNGDEFPMDFALNRMDSDGAPKLVGIARDNTDRKRMEEELHRANFLSDIALDLTGCGYWHIDYNDPDYYYQSQRASRMLGEPDKPDGRYHLQDEWFARLLEANKETAALTADRYQGAIDGRFENYESIYAYKRPLDGQIIWLHALGKVERDQNGKALYMYGAYQDITLQRESELATLEAQRAAEAANRAKSDFLSQMSHELRTPLNGILGYAQILHRDSQLTSGQKKNVKAILNCGEHLLALINDVLDLSKIEAGKLEVDSRPADLHELIHAVGDVVAQRARIKGLNFEINVSPEVPRGIVTDAPKLRQILINLAGNAVKFTEEGGVSINVSESPKSTLQLEVVDSGVGISREELELIFDAFRQVEAGKDAGGTGLGLSISRRLAKALGGELTVKSERGKGSVFTTRIPLIETELDNSGVLQEENTLRGELIRLVPGQKCRILVADDRETNRDVLQSLLETAGFEVCQAVDGQDALDVLRQTPGTDMVLMDVRMPRLNGIEAIKQIRADDHLKAIKVMAVTASVFPEFRRSAIDSGFDDFLGKPFRADDLMQKLQKHLHLEFEEIDETTVTKPPAGETQSAGSVAALPREKTERLKQALQIKNLSAIKGLAKELIADADTIEIGNRIMAYAGSFDFMNLTNLLIELESAG